MIYRIAIVLSVGIAFLGLVAGVAYLVHIGPTIRITYTRTTQLGSVNGDFLEALESGDLKTVVRMLEAEPHLLKTFRFGGESALYHAVSYSQHDVATELLKRGADVNASVQDRDMATYGQTPLMVAVLLDDIEMVRILLAHGASLEGKERWGHTVTELAQEKPAILGLLKEAQLGRK